MKPLRLSLRPARREPPGPRRSGHLRTSLRRAWVSLPRALPAVGLVEVSRDQPLFFTALRGLLDRNPGITLGQVIEEAGEQVWGLTVLLLALLTLVPGVANLVSLATLLVGLLMMRGAAQPWLPQTLRRMVLHQGRIKALLAKVESHLAWLAERRGPRKAPGKRFMGFLVAWTAFVAALPIPLPLANALPAAALILFGVALLEEWPFLAWLGTALSLGTIVYLGFSLHEILVMFTGMGRWLVHVIQPGWL